jgi:hypothetical protein
METLNTSVFLPGFIPSELGVPQYIILSSHILGELVVLHTRSQYGGVYPHNAGILHNPFVFTHVC